METTKTTNKITLQPDDLITLHLKRNLHRGKTQLQGYWNGTKIVATYVLEHMVDGDYIVVVSKVLPTVTFVHVLHQDDQARFAPKFGRKQVTISGAARHDDGSWSAFASDGRGEDLTIPIGHNESIPSPGSVYTAEVQVVRGDWVEYTRNVYMIPIRFATISEWDAQQRFVNETEFEAFFRSVGNAVYCDHAGYDVRAMFASMPGRYAVRLFRIGVSEYGDIILVASVKKLNLSRTEELLRSLREGVSCTIDVNHRFTFHREGVVHGLQWRTEDLHLEDGPFGGLHLTFVLNERPVSIRNARLCEVSGDIVGLWEDSEFPQSEVQFKFTRLRFNTTC